MSGLNYSRRKLLFNPQAKLLTHADRVKTWLDTGHVFPILAEISPTGFCNARCPWCSFNGKKSKEKIDYYKLTNAITDMKIVGLKAINWTGGGEPTIYPEFEKCVRLCKSLGIEQGLFTNGYQEIPLQENFSWIRVSITDTGLDNVVRPRVPFGIVLNQTEYLSANDIESFCISAREMGASYFQVRPALTGDFKTQPHIEPPNFIKKRQTDSFAIEVTEYKYREAQKGKEYHECYGFNFVPSIDWNGKVSVCLYRTLEDAYILGDLNVDTFHDIWERLPQSVPAVDSCWNCCKNHEINKILFSAKNITQRNFL